MIQTIILQLMCLSSSCIPCRSTLFQFLHTAVKLWFCQEVHQLFIITTTRWLPIHHFSTQNPTTAWNSSYCSVQNDLFCTRPFIVGISAFNCALHYQSSGTCKLSTENKQIWIFRPLSCKNGYLIYSNVWCPFHSAFCLCDADWAWCIMRFPWKNYFYFSPSCICSISPSYSFWFFKQCKNL